MGMFDTVKGILEPYDPQFKCWGDTMETYVQGDQVPPVGIARTYAIRLNAPEGEPDRFLWVQDCVITALMAHQPIVQKGVFNKWGDYLGDGGESLDEMPDRSNREPPVPMTDLLKRPTEASKINKASRPNLKCPGCGVPYFDENGQRSDGSWLCCNPRCKGEWGTGCYHCHHPKFWEDTQDNEEEEKETPPPMAATGEMKVWSFPLRSNMVVRLDLPLNITSKEAERVAWFVKSLVINS